MKYFVDAAVAAGGDGSEKKPFNKRTVINAERTIPIRVPTICSGKSELERISENINTI